MPNAPPGATIGLFGGSFDPPHRGHLLVAQSALKRARLNRIWWLVTPGNPLKETGRLQSIDRRVQLSKALVRDRRIVVTAFEASLQSRYSEDTIRILRCMRPFQKFVWLMGADNLASFHKWRNWRRIAAMVPMIIVDRPGADFALLNAPAARALARFRLPERDAALVPLMKPPVWTFLHGPRLACSSTRIRAEVRKMSQI